ncbi:hypothetical protein [Pseudomonas aeruginosa]|nr:hypothetical protein [Pseudomonas aeruginosa]
MSAGQVRAIQAAAAAQQQAGQYFAAAQRLQQSDPATVAEALINK